MRLGRKSLSSGKGPWREINGSNRHIFKSKTNFQLLGIYLREGAAFYSLFYHLTLSTLAGSEQEISSVQLLSHVQLFETPWTSMPGLPVHHQLPEFTQTHAHWVGGAIQPPHPLSSPSPAFNLFQNQSLFKWVSSSHQVAKVLEFLLQTSIWTGDNILQ